MFLVDSHCHLDMLKLNNLPTGEEGGLAAVLATAEEAGVKHFLCVNVHPNQLANLRQLTQGFSNVSLSLGLHPGNHPSEEPAITAEELIEEGKAEDIVAIGETGLDYYYSADFKQEQQASFQAHLDAALALNKPVIVHTREAGDDTLKLLKPFTEQGGRGVIHCFTENLDFARQAIGMGLYISFSGILTFKNATELQAVAKQLPLDRLLVETDAPYLAPVPYRGKQNQPAYVKEVAQYLADLKGQSLEFIAQQTTENFLRLFTGVKLAV